MYVLMLYYIQTNHSYAVIGMTTLLQVSPQGHLTFRGPFTATVTSVLNLTNPTTEKVSKK